jgi:hypothetical protein
MPTNELAKESISILMDSVGSSNFEPRHIKKNFSLKLRDSF